MSTPAPVRVFIGSGEVSRIERKVLIHALRKHSRRDLDIYVFNGTHNAIERNDDPPFEAPLSLRLKYRNSTEFSLYRYLIPEICDFQGRGLYVDSDMVVLRDIGELFDTPMNGCDFLARRAYEPAEWGTSVMLIDCARARFDLDAIFKDIDTGKFTYFDFSHMSPKFCQQHPYKIGQLDPTWNSFDYHDASTKLIHYTELSTQPWRKAGHRYGELWFQYFNEARAAGLVTEDDIHLGIMRGAARPDIRLGNRPNQPPASRPGRISLLTRAKLAFREFKRKFKQAA